MWSQKSSLLRWSRRHYPLDQTIICLFRKYNMPRKTRPSHSKVERKEEEERENPATLVAALEDLPFKDDMDFEDWMQITRFYVHLHPHRQRVPLFLHALPQELFLSAIKAGVTSDSDIDYRSEILSQLAIDQRERSLAREFFHRDQKVGGNDEDYSRSLQLLAERAFRGCSPARVTSWAAVQFCAGVQPPTIAARLNAMKTDDPNQLVKAAIRIRQELPLTSASQTAHRWSNPPRSRWIPSRQTPRAGETYCSLS
ncbi:hypothetical protein TSMEX_008926 [Taenia solium]|eukprot:TsM_001156700 transcript=TsM_001156700 gene=TsM_001156700